jgi:hypothetical protein
MMTQPTNIASTNPKSLPPPPAAQPTERIHALETHDMAHHTRQFLVPKEIALFLTANRTIYTQCKVGMLHDWKKRTSLPSLAELRLYRQFIPTNLMPIGPKMQMVDIDAFSEWVNRTIPNLQCTRGDNGIGKERTLNFLSHPDRILAPHPDKEPCHVDTIAWVIIRYKHVTWTTPLVRDPPESEKVNNQLSRPERYYPPTGEPYDPTYIHYPVHALYAIRTGKELSLDHLNKSLDACFDRRWGIAPSVAYAQALVVAGATSNFHQLLLNCFTLIVQKTVRPLEPIKWCLKTGNIDLSAVYNNKNSPLYRYNVMTLLQMTPYFPANFTWPPTGPDAPSGAFDTFFSSLFKLLLAANAPSDLGTIWVAARRFLPKTVALLLRPENREKLPKEDLPELDRWLTSSSEFVDSAVLSVVKSAHERLAFAKREQTDNPQADMKGSIDRIDREATATIDALVAAGASPQVVFSMESSQLPLLTACLERYQKAESSSAATTATAAK